MARASYTQGNFISGEWSPSSQGRTDLPGYKSALALCRNAIVSETGAVIRRSGTRLISPTYDAKLGYNYDLPFEQQQNYVMEQTYDGTHVKLRFMRGGHMVTDNNPFQLTAVSAASPTEITLVAPAAWSTGDVIQIQMPKGAPPKMWSFLMNRPFVVAKLDTTHFTLTDAATGANVDATGTSGALPQWPHAVLIPSLTLTEWDGSGLGQMRVITVGEQALIIPNPSGYGPSGTGGLPALLTQSGATNTTYPTFALNRTLFRGGPYGVPVLNAALTLTYISGANFTFTDSSGAFVAAQIDDPIRINIIAPLWDSGHDYKTDTAVVTDPNGGQYVNINVTPTSSNGHTGATDPALANAGNLPSQSPNFWAPYANGSIQFDAFISAVASTTSITITGLIPMPVAITGTYAYFPTSYQLARYSAVNAFWPATGIFHEGRIYMGDSGQGIQASKVFGFSPEGDPTGINFYPTDQFGNVLDDSGIDEELLSSGTNGPLWMIPDANGILVGTQAGEWLIQATTLGAPLTPTSFQAHQFTRYGSAPSINPVVRPGIGVVFIDRYSARLMEYITDPFTQKFSGRPLNQYAKDLARYTQNGDGLSVLAYSETPEPIIWTMGINSSLLGCTYRRVSSFTTEVPLFFAFHLHTHGNGRAGITTVCNSFTVNGTQDQPYFQVFNFGIGRAFNECLEPLWNEAQDTLQTCWPLDGGVTGINYGDLVGGGSDSGPMRCEGGICVDDGVNMVIGGLWYFIGETLTAWIGGLDFGDYVVDATGCITVPYASDPGGIGTKAYLLALNGATLPGAGSSWPNVPNWPSMSYHTNGDNYNIPVVVGFRFRTELQRLRPDDQETARTTQGSGSGSLRRHHWYSFLLAAGVANTIEVGTNPAGAIFPASLTNYDTGQPTATNVVFSGVFRDTIQSDYDLDGQLYIRLDRPAPFTIASWTGFMETNEI